MNTGVINQHLDYDNGLGFGDLHVTEPQSMTDFRVMLNNPFDAAMLTASDAARMLKPRSISLLE